MSKYYAQWRRPKLKPRPWRVHPIWRGIGCFLMLLIPILSYGVSDLVIRANLDQRWVTIPSEFTGPAGYPYLIAKLLLAVVMAVGIFGVFTLIYTFVYRITGPSKYGPVDAPPIRRKPAARKKRR